MKVHKRILIVLLCFLLILSGCKKASRNEEPAEAEPEERLQLELVLSESEYEADQPIACKAILSYVGEGESFTFYSGEPVVMFAIKGGEYFKGELDLLNKGQYSQTIYKNEPIEFPFAKYQGWHLNTDEAAVRFWENFLADDRLILEPGEYEIFVRCSYMLKPGGESTTCSVSKKITVK